MSQPFRSRPRIRRQTELPAEPEVVEGVLSEAPQQALVPFEPENEVLPVDAPILPPRPIRPQKTAKREWAIRPGLLILAFVLIASGIFFTLLNVATLNKTVVEWWPAVMLGGAVLWILLALFRQDATAFLGGAGAMGISTSLLLETQKIASVGETMVGAILISLGLGIMMRGLLLRPRSV